MNKYKEIYGIDISKDVFDVYGSQSGHNQFKNDAKGFVGFKLNHQTHYRTPKIEHMNV